MRYDNVLKTTKYVLFYIFQFEKNVSLPILSELLATIQLF
jgi:hypothetical protein